MDLLVKEILINASWAGAAGLFVWKVLGPLVHYFLTNNMNGDRQSFRGLQDEVETIRENHVEHLKEDIHILKNEKQDIKSSLNELGNRVTRLETIVEHNGDKK